MILGHFWPFFGHFGDFFFKNKRKIRNQGKIAVILSINTSKVKKVTFWWFWAIFGHFGPFLAIFGIFFQKWPTNSKSGQNCGHFEYKHFESQKKVIFGWFWAIFGHFWWFWPFWPFSVKLGPEGQIWVFEAPKPFGDTFYVILEEKKVFWKNKFGPFWSKRTWKNFWSGPQKPVFGLRRGFGPIWGLLGPCLTLLGPSVGSNVCIKCFLWPQNYLESP